MTITTDTEPIAVPAAFSDPDTPGARFSIFDLGTRGMGDLDDAALEAVVTAMRDDARALYEKYALWVRVIRTRRTVARKSERVAAKETGVSRATMRKATSGKR